MFLSFCGEMLLFVLLMLWRITDHHCLNFPFLSKESEEYNIVSETIP